jgi:hypothetical protein
MLAFVQAARTHGEPAARGQEGLAGIARPPVRLSISNSANRRRTHQRAQKKIKTQPGTAPACLSSGPSAVPALISVQAVSMSGGVPEVKDSL